jgi:ribosomal protein L2
MAVPLSIKPRASAAALAAAAASGHQDGITPGSAMARDCDHPHGGGGTHTGGVGTDRPLVTLARAPIRLRHTRR